MNISRNLISLIFNANGWLSILVMMTLYVGLAAGNATALIPIEDVNTPQVDEEMTILLQDINLYSRGQPVVLVTEPFVEWIVLPEDVIEVIRLADPYRYWAPLGLLLPHKRNKSKPFGKELPTISGLCISFEELQELLTAEKGLQLPLSISADSNITSFSLQALYFKGTMRYVNVYRLVTEICSTTGLPWEMSYLIGAMSFDYDCENQLSTIRIYESSDRIYKTNHLRQVCHWEFFRDESGRINKAKSLNPEYWGLPVGGPSPFPLFRGELISIQYDSQGRPSRIYLSWPAEWKKSETTGYRKIIRKRLLVTMLKWVCDDATGSFDFVQKGVWSWSHQQVKWLYRKSRVWRSRH